CFARRAVFTAQPPCSMTPPSSSRSAAWPAIAPPIAPQVEHEILQLGRRRVDLYDWMRFTPSSGSRELGALPPLLDEYLQAEMAYAQGMLAPLSARVAQFHQAMLKRVPSSPTPPPSATQGWTYHASRPAGHAHRRFARTRPDGSTQTLL